MAVAVGGICMSDDVGQQGGLRDLRWKALATGATDFFGEDLRKVFEEEFSVPTRKISARLTAS